VTISKRSSGNGNLWASPVINGIVSADRLFALSSIPNEKSIPMMNFAKCAPVRATSPVPVARSRTCSPPFNLHSRTISSAIGFRIGTRIAAYFCEYLPYASVIREENRLLMPSRIHRFTSKQEFQLRGVFVPEVVFTLTRLGNSGSVLAWRKPSPLLHGLCGISFTQT